MQQSQRQRLPSLREQIWRERMWGGCVYLNSSQFNNGISSFFKKDVSFFKKSLGNEQTIREHQNIFILNMWISSYVKEGSWTRYF